MKKKSFVFTVLGAAVFLLLVMNACNKSSTQKVKSSSLTMKAITHLTGTGLASIPVTGGVLDISSAFVNIVNLSIEENSGNDVQNQSGSQNEGGDSGIDNDSINEGGEGIDNDSINEGGGEADSSNVFLTGPYALDITTGQAAIAQVSIYPGTFKKVNFLFQTSTATEFYGNSIVIKGLYTPTSGSPVPFTIESVYSKHVQLPIANGGITVTANSQVSIAIVFDINAWLSNLDYANALIANGKILINSTNNSSLLSAFETNLSTNIDAEGE